MAGTMDDQRQRIESFLAARHPAGAKIKRYSPIVGGYSRLMAEFVADIEGREMHLIWRGDPPREQQIAITDRSAEYALLSALSTVNGSPAPRPLYFDADGSALGATSMIIEYVEGDQLMGLLKRGPEAQWPQLVDHTCRLAATIHRTDLERLPSRMTRPANWSRHIDNCIASWRALEAEQVEPAPLIRYVTTWLDRNRPPPVPLTLLHGDLQSPNILIDGERVAAIDWEFARIGDPREDLGWFLSMAAVSPPDPVRGNLEDFCRCYRRYSGLDEAQINPRSLSYFSILPYGPMIRHFSSVVADLVAGKNRSLQAANLAMVVTAMVQGWIGAIRTLDGIETTQIMETGS